MYRSAANIDADIMITRYRNCICCIAIERPTEKIVPSVPQVALVARYVVPSPNLSSTLQKSTKIILRNAVTNIYWTTESLAKRVDDKRSVKGRGLLQVPENILQPTKWIEQPSTLVETQDRKSDYILKAFWPHMPGLSKDLEWCIGIPSLNAKQG